MKLVMDGVKCSECEGMGYMERGYLMGNTLKGVKEICPLCEGGGVERAPDDRTGVVWDKEEIREGIRGIIKGGVCQDFSGVDIGTTPEDILDYLDSQGVVIKEKCSQCSWYEFSGETAGMAPCYECNSTGYKWSPLI